MEVVTPCFSTRLVTGFGQVTHFHLKMFYSRVGMQEVASQPIACKKNKL